MKTFSIFQPRLLMRLSLLTLSVWTPIALSADPDECKMPEIDHWAKATFATRGDTLIVQGQLIRLIGVVAPEIEKKQKLLQPGQPLAQVSQTFLNKLIANNEMEVGLVYDEQKRDNAGRTLAHVFFKDGSNATTRILEAGLGIAEATPPNTQFMNCYFAAEQTARNQGIALWGIAKKMPQLHYPIAESTTLYPNDIGYRIIRGKVVKVDKSSTNIIINMDTTGIRVPKKYWKYFDYGDIQDLMDKTIEVRGYAFQYRRAMFMSIESPDDIDLLRKARKTNEK